MKLLRASLFAAAIFCAAPSVWPAPPVAKHVFIISFDGGKPSVMQVSNMPTLQRLVHDGAATWQARTVLPSVTLVAHSSMLSGVMPRRHGMLWDDWEPQRGLIRVPTIFAIAKQHRMITGMIVGKSKFRHLDVPGTLDIFSIPGWSAYTCSRTAAAWILRAKPNLCFIHFGDSDGAGHKYGWGSKEQIDSFHDEDNALAVIMNAIAKAGLASSSVVILSADHGGHNHIHGTKSPQDMLIPWIVWGVGVRGGFTITAAVNTCDTAATALWALGIPPPANWDGKPVVSAFR